MKIRNFVHGCLLGFAFLLLTGCPTDITLTDVQAVAADTLTLTASELTFSGSDSPTSVTSDIGLPQTGENGTTITWSSNSTVVISNTGEVTKPAAGQSNANITLTATITKGSISETKSFSITVMAESSVLADAENLTINQITLAGSDTKDNITQSITLPLVGDLSSTISWSSNNSSYLDADGTVSRPGYSDPDEEVILTATITKGSETTTKTFTFVVVCHSASSSDILTLSISDIVFGGSDSYDSVTQNMTFPATGDLGASISWTSNKIGTISNAGTVSRPTFSSGTDVITTVTATITVEGTDETKEFELTVKVADPVLVDVIGDGVQAFTPGTGTAAQLNSPRGFCYDGSANIYGCDRGAHVIYKVDMATKVMTLLAGNSGTSGFNDATGAVAEFSSPSDITFLDGSLYVLDQMNMRIRKINPATGAVTTIVGNGSNTVADGIGTAATINFNCRGITNDGTDLYFSDYASVRKVTISTGVVTTLCSNDAGPGLIKGFTQNLDAVEHVDGFIYGTANNAGHCIYKINATTGEHSIFAGQIGVMGNVDGIGTAAKITQPEGIIYDGTGYLYFTEQTRVKKLNIETAEVITVLDTVWTSLQYPMGILFIDSKIYLSVQNHYKIMTLE